jgi:hypothetical protein
MKPRYATPRDLVEALQARAPQARAQLAEILRDPLARLMAQFRASHSFDADLDVLTAHALHLAETFLRTRPLDALDGVGWNAFRSTVLIHIAKVAYTPFANTGSLAGPTPLPDSPEYQSRTFFAPYERLGNYCFGGDWFAGWQTADGALWVLLADVTGHGYYAYLLASGLPGVWQACWNALSAPAPQPAAVLAAMHHLLQDCLPEGVFLECTLVRLAPDGIATVVPAGGTRLLLRRHNAGRADLVKLRGMWLGLSPPSAQDEQTWTLEHGDELLLATDGVFDQLDEANDLEEVSLSPGSSANLFDAVHDLLQSALASEPQRDDMTMVLLRRRVRAEGEGPLRTLPGHPAQNGAGDVPV